MHRTSFPQHSVRTLDLSDDGTGTRPVVFVSDSAATALERIRRSPPVMSVVPRPRQRLEFRFDTLFLHNRSDRLESPNQWWEALPALAVTLLHLSLSQQDDEACTQHALEAVQRGADPFEKDLSYGRTVLHWACLLARPALVDFLLQQGAVAQLEQRDVFGHSPLELALQNPAGAADVAMLMLKAGASLDALPLRGSELLYLPDLDVALARRLLAAGVPVDGPSAGPVEGSASPRVGTPLISACRHGLWAVAFELLDSGADAGRRGLHGESVLHHPHLPAWLADQLILRGAPVDAPDELGVTPLMLACAERNVPLARCLIDAGARIDLVPQDDWRRLVAAASGSTDRVAEAPRYPRPRPSAGGD